MVPRIARQPQPQQSRADRFRLRRVRARMLATIPAEDLPAVFHIQLQQRPRRQHQQRRQPRGDKIEHIVHPRGHKSDVLVRRLHIAKHRIHRVHGLVEKAERRAADRQKQHWRDHAVRRVLRHGLHRRLGHALSGLVQTPMLQRRIDLHALVPQRLRREDLSAHHALHRQPQPDAHARAAPEEQRRKGRSDQCRQDPDTGSGGPLTAGRLRKKAAEQPFQQ